MDIRTDRFVRLAGETNFAIGKMHGTVLADAIRKNINFYLKSFNQPEESIHELADYFGLKIATFSKDYDEEIRGIAEGAQVPLWQVYMLNARSEIFSTFIQQGQNQGITECTLLFFPETSIMAENWDWALEISSQTFIFEISKGNHKPILTLSEAGILAKIGLSSFGFGIGMNYLAPAEKPSGVPIHIVIRKALDQTSFTDARNIFQQFGQGISGNVCLGNSDGQYVGFEFDGLNTYEILPTTLNKYYCHTNHYLGKEDPNKNKTLDNATTSTAIRFLQAEKIVQTLPPMVDENTAKAVLSNHDHPEFPILVPQTKSDSLGEIGTIASIILSLKEKKMSVTYALEGFKVQHEYYLN